MNRDPVLAGVELLEVKAQETDQLVDLKREPPFVRGSEITLLGSVPTLLQVQYLAIEPTRTAHTGRWPMGKYAAVAARIADLHREREPSARRTHTSRTKLPIAAAQQMHAEGDLPAKNLCILKKVAQVGVISFKGNADVWPPKNSPCLQRFLD
ncbi:hypothetical protein [Ruegeria faecimaris]|uniref:hypothetical protein n=1 Tax=Ruegeria faecimaris TaxID=686389 RepID=UPI002490B6FF|nr:hypothetical protein [Ruegeria faecimaris]